MHFKVKRLACIKGNQYLFRNLNFSLSAGELVLVQGPNGSGKSSLLKILAGLASSEQGSVEHTSEIAYVGHKDGIKKGLSVIENIRLQLALGQQSSQINEIERVLETFRLHAQRDKLCAALSMGQRRKVALASLVLKQKPIWILDEPFTGLDNPSVEALCGYFNSHLSKSGMIVVASHAISEIKAHQTIELAPC